MLPIYSRAVALFETKAEEFALQVVLLCDEEEEGLLIQSQGTGPLIFVNISVDIFFPMVISHLASHSLKSRTGRGKTRKTKLVKRFPPRICPIPRHLSCAISSVGA